MRRIHLRRTLLAPLLFLPAHILFSQNLQEFEKKVTEFTLPNGLHFVVVERHEAPVVSFHTYVNAGSVDDPKGETGLAHMFEHMAFKGTETIGTSNWPEEKRAMQQIEEIYDELAAERNKGPKADDIKIRSLGSKLKLAIDKAAAFVTPNEYTRIIEENGGAGLNAGTNISSTEYFYSLPSNRLELWFLLESQRFLHPVFREFYKERDVVMEEERMRVESSAQGKLFQDFISTAFMAHPYHNPPAGWPSDIANLRVSAAKQFFSTYYVPGNINIAIVGDVNPAEAKRMAERYFGPMQARPLPAAIDTVEPPQRGPRTAEVYVPSQPIVVLGYKRPDQYDKSDPVFDVLSLILSGGRTGVLYRDMVEEKQMALDAEAVATYPDGRYPNLFVFALEPNQGHTAEENEKELDRVLTKFVADPVDPEALKRAKTKLRATVIRQLDSNSGLASLLTHYYADYGDWRKLFTQIADSDKVTAEDVQRVARATFVSQNRTIAFTAAPPAGQGQRPQGGSGK